MSPCWCCGVIASTTSISARRRFLPILGAVCCAFLVGPWTGRDPAQYRIASVLLAIGVVLWVVTALVNRATGLKPAEPAMADIGGPGPVN
jgi:APA family basic amino acid/polyamine antiporter